MNFNFLELDEKIQTEVINEIASKTERDSYQDGTFYEGEIYIEGKKYPCRGYISPDGKVLRFQIGIGEVLQCLSETACLGFSVGDSVPDWAVIE